MWLFLRCHTVTTCVESGMWTSVRRRHDLSRKVFWYPYVALSWFYR